MTPYSIKNIQVEITAMMVLIACAMPSISTGCNYGKFGLKPGDPSQTTVDGLFSGKYQVNQEFKVNDWRMAATADAEKATDVPGKLDYAWALHMSNQNPAAVAVYKGILQSSPEDYEALCSYATVLHSMREYDFARQVLEKAIKLKPGFRSGAEEFHLDLINYEQKRDANFKYAEENVFVPELTLLWKNLKDVDNNLSTVEFPKDLTSAGLAELVRQYPLKGDTWFALAMLLEHEKDFSMAVKSYDRALEHGTAHSPEIKKYMTTFREFGRAQDPGRVMGRRLVQLIIGFAILAVLFFIFRIASRVISDVTSHRAMKEDEKRRIRRNDPNSPLK